jgi:hypothetical protein
MTKWEYVELQVVSTLTGLHADATLFKPDGKHIQRSDKFGVLLAQLGADGWEVVAVSPRGETGVAHDRKMNYVLKREMKGE